MCVCTVCVSISVCLYLSLSLYPCLCLSLSVSPCLFLSVSVSLSGSASPFLSMPMPVCDPSLPHLLPLSVFIHLSLRLARITIDGVAALALFWQLVCKVPHQHLKGCSYRFFQPRTGAGCFNSPSSTHPLGHFLGLSWRPPASWELKGTPCKRRLGGSWLENADNV